MGYAERCEYLAGEGFSGSDAARLAGGGSIRGMYSYDEEEEGRDPDCPTEEQFDADPAKYVWIQKFGSGFRVYAYDPTAKDGYEVYTVADKETRVEAEQAVAEWVERVTAEIAEAKNK